METYQIELSQSELNTVMSGLLSYANICRDRNVNATAVTCESLYDKLFETSCPAPVPVPNTDKGGASFLPNLDLFDGDLPPVFGGE